jgi:hypothetical protein
MERAGTVPARFLLKDATSHSNFGFRTSMYLRHVLLIMSAIGAVGSLLMALDFYRRLKEAERVVFVNNISPGPDSVLHTGMGHLVGLIALGLIFLALLIVLLPALKDKALVTAIEGAQPVSESQAMPSPVASENTTPAAVATDAETRGGGDAGNTSSPEPGNTPAEERPTVS